MAYKYNGERYSIEGDAMRNGSCRGDRPPGPRPASKAARRAPSTSAPWAAERHAGSTNGRAISEAERYRYVSAETAAKLRELARSHGYEFFPGPVQAGAPAMARYRFDPKTGRLASLEAVVVDHRGELIHLIQTTTPGDRSRSAGLASGAGVPGPVRTATGGGRRAKGNAGNR